MRVPPTVSPDWPGVSDDINVGIPVYLRLEIPPILVKLVAHQVQQAIRIVAQRQRLAGKPACGRCAGRHGCQRGDDAAVVELTPLVYEELRRLAHHYMKGQRPNHTLQTTALVNEAYLRLADQTNPNWQSRAHFFAVAARAMRGILVNYAKSNRAQKRGGGAARIELDEAAIVSPAESKEIVDLHEALE